MFERILPAMGDGNIFYSSKMILSLYMRKIIAVLMAICLSSCYGQKAIGEALAESDSLYAVGRQSLDEYPALRAVLYYQRAIDVLPDNQASLSRKATLFNEMGRLMAKQQLYQEAIGRYELALQCATSLPDTLAMIDAYMGMGDAYRSLSNFQEAMRCLNQAGQLAVKQKDVKAQNAVALRKAAAYCETGNTDKGQDQLPKSLDQLSEDDGHLYNYVMAHIYEQKSNGSDSVNHFLDRLMESGVPSYRQYAINKKVQQAIRQRDYNLLSSLFELQRDVEKDREMEARFEASGNVGALYQALHTEREKASLFIKNQRMQFLVVIGLLTLVLVIAIAIMLLYRMRSEKMRMQRNQALLEKYNEALQADLKEERLKTSTPQPDTDKKTLAIREADIYQRLLASEKPMNEADGSAMMALVDSLYPDFKTRLTTFGVIKEHELKMCYLIKMGFKPSRIAILLSRSDSAISNGRMRLYRKVFGQEGRGEDWDKVIQSL